MKKRCTISFRCQSGPLPLIPHALAVDPDSFDRHVDRAYILKESIEIKCPTCVKKGLWLEGPFGLFCSRRCKLADLGKWLGEEHVISEPLRPDHLETVQPEEESPKTSELE